MNAYSPVSPSLETASSIIELQRIVGATNVLTQTDDIAPYATDWRGNFRGTPLAVVKPASTNEVASVVQFCVKHSITIVPQAGNTGLVGGGVPDLSGRQIILNISRMNKMREIDLANNTITVEAGMVLQTLQENADKNDRLFPVSLAAEGSCEVGGIIATNAGGVQVLKYGNTREQVLGLEVVLPSGEVWNGLRGLRKDNTGYDLKQLMIGSEGTLGVVTAATLKLWTKPTATQTMLLALNNLQDCVKALQIIKKSAGDRITAFEVFSRFCLDIAIKHVSNIVDPMNEPSPWYALVELSDSTDETTLAAQCEQTFGVLFEESLVTDGVVAQSQAQSQALWNIREHIPEAEKLYGKAVKHDISLPISAIPIFVEQAEAALAQSFPNSRVINFGHLGDGNLHFNVAGSTSENSPETYKQGEAINTLVYDLVHAHNGSISAEHGLGQLKRESITRYKSAVEMSIMRAIKKAIDPTNMMNPGKLL